MQDFLYNVPYFTNTQNFLYNVPYFTNTQNFLTQIFLALIFLTQIL